MLFILGRGRSGTSLVSRILNQHDDIVVPPEGCFIRNCHGRFKRGLETPRHARNFVKTLRTENRMKNWDLDFPDLVDSIVEGLPMTFQRVCHLVIEHWATHRGKGGAAIIADKNPHYSLWARNIGRIFPSARFIHVVRDPYDNIASFQNVRFDINDAVGLALRWSAFNESILDADLGSRRFQLRYEELVEAPDTTMRDLCSFLDVDYSDGFFEYQGGKERLSSWHKNLSGPINTRRVGYGRDNLSTQQINLCSSILTPVARCLGYEIKEECARANLLTLVRGKATLFSERNIYCLPLIIRSPIINAYRRWAGSL